MLVTNNTEIRKFLPASVSITFARIEPFIEVAEKKYIKEVFGLAFLTELNAYHKLETQDNEYLNEVLSMTQRSVTYLAFYEGFDILSVSIKDTGFFRVENNENKSLFNYQEKKLRDYFSNTGYNTLEDVLEYMEANLAQFTTWADSDAYQNNRKYFINSAKEFTEIYKPLKKSRLVFLNIQSDLKAAEDFDIKSILGTALFDKLKDLVLDKDIEEAEFIEYKKLLPYVQNVLAYRTVVRCIKNLGANFTDKGLFFASFENTDKNFKRETPNTEQTLALIGGATENANQYQDQLESYLLESKEVLPEYAEFIGDEDQTFDPSFDNEDKKIIRM
jgi:hypothetical protein